MALLCELSAEASAESCLPCRPRIYPPVHVLVVCGSCIISAMSVIMPIVVCGTMDHLSHL